MSRLDTITKFRGRYRFLSNFYPAIIVYNKQVWRSAEHLYQALKTTNPKEQELFLDITAAEAKKLGRKITIREDWDDVKVEIMENVVNLKFDQNPDLQKRLMDTGDSYIIEGNYWGDTFWGVCRGVGHNHLGMILMRYRGRLIKNQETVGELFGTEGEEH